MILYITENDIVEGKLTDGGSKLKCIISKLGEYDNEKDNPYNEIDRFSDKDLAEYLVDKYPHNIAEKIFDYYPVHCESMHNVETERLDRLAGSLEKDGCDKIKTVTKMINLVRSVSQKNESPVPVVDNIKSIIEEYLNDDISVSDIAKKAGISVYYMMHIFKKNTGISIVEYRKEIKLTKAKRMLFKTDEKISSIAQECGFGSSAYFSKIFIQSEGISPSEYRKNSQHN